MINIIPINPLPDDSIMIIVEVELLLLESQDSMDIDAFNYIKNKLPLLRYVRILVRHLLYSYSYS